jgi:predicted ATPase
MPNDSLRRPLRRVMADPDSSIADDQWPATLPAVAHLLRDGLDLGAVTVLVGDNGSGKSTLIEAVAMAFGMSPEGGSTLAAHSTRESESGLDRCLRISRGQGGSRWGYFIRAETMHGLYTYLEEHRSTRGDNRRYHELSHGESVLALIESRSSTPGLYVLDEPEAGLSFESTLALSGLLADIAADPRSQVLLATHSPILSAIPGATIYEVGPWGLRRSRWADLPLVRHWQLFLREPDTYLDHINPSRPPRTS